MISRFTISLFISVAMLSCSNENEDITETVNKDGAIETAVQVAHLDSTHDILTTSHKIWVKNGLYRTVEYNDTLPTLGVEHTIAENKDGNTQNVTINKEYEIYITVK